MDSAITYDTYGTFSFYILVFKRREHTIYYSKCKMIFVIYTIETIVIYIIIPQENFICLV